MRTQHNHEGKASTKPKKAPSFAGLASYKVVSSLVLSASLLCFWILYDPFRLLGSERDLVNIYAVLKQIVVS